MINERPHKKLDVWKKSIDLVTLIYEMTKSLPREEDFGIKSQMRRAAISVSSSLNEPCAIFRKCNLSLIVFLVSPSAIFDGTEKAALLI